MTAPGGAPSGNGNGNRSAGTGRPLAAVAPPSAGPAPGPVPMTFNVGQAQTIDGKVWVSLQVNHAAGTTVCFLEPDAARTIGAELVRLAGAGQFLLGQPAPPPGA